jgi:glycosyltransferase involved in cell wall biosynthesis
MIPTYKGVRYLGAALESVLAQAPAAEEMQIEVIDDGSPDDLSRELVERIAGSRVAFFRKPRNEGLVANFNTCIERSRGEFVHILHDDDIVLPGFYAQMESALDADTSLGAAFSRYVGIDGQARWRYVSPTLFESSRKIDRPALQLGRRNFIRTPAIVVRRSTYERIGGFDPRVSHTADWEMWVRIAAHTDVWYEDRPLALYREHAGSDTSNLARSGENLRQIRKAIDIFHAYLPAEIRSGCRGLGHVWAAMIGWHTAKALLRRRDLSSCARVLTEIARCLPRPDEAWRGLILELGLRREARADAVADARN